MRCQDIEDDGCDDCVSGDFAPFDDGPNADGDHLCDEGDPDDDNDGCEDGIDPFPFDPSVDDDLDFVGADCDNCPDDFNLGQVDYDQDGLGDVCDPTPMPEPGAGSLALMAIGVLCLLRARYAVTNRAAARPLRRDQPSCSQRWSERHSSRGIAGGWRPRVNHERAG